MPRSPRLLQAKRSSSASAATRSFVKSGGCAMRRWPRRPGQRSKRSPNASIGNLSSRIRPPRRSHASASLPAATARSSSATSCGDSARRARRTAIACDSPARGRRIASADFQASDSLRHEGAHSRGHLAAGARRPPSQQGRRARRRGDHLGGWGRSHLSRPERRARRRRDDREGAGAARLVTLLAHAIAASPPAEVSPGGIRGRPLAWSETGGLGLWSTEWAPDIKLERPDALEHHRLVERICAAQPCLPVRFGTAFATSDEARASLDKRAAGLRAALARVAGKSELALTLLWREPSATPKIASAAGPGRQY